MRLRSVLPAFLAAFFGAVFSIPTALAPWVPRDAPSHSFGIAYAWKILVGEASPTLCKYWYTGFPYTGTYGFLPYILASPLYPLLGGYRSYGVAMVIAAALFSLSVYLFARSVGLGKRHSLEASAMASAGMTAQWVYGGIYPMTLSMAFGLMANALSERRFRTSTLLLTASFYSHPAGGILSSITMLLRGLYTRNAKPIVQVGLALAIALPFYVRFSYIYPVMSSLVNFPPSITWVICTTIFSPGLPLIFLGALGSVYGIKKKIARSLCLTSLTCLIIAWSTAGLVMITHKFPSRNFLLDRITCVWITPLMSISSAVWMTSMTPIVETIITPSVCIFSLYSFVIVNDFYIAYPEKRTWRDIKDAWIWSSHQSNDLRVTPGPIVKYFKLPVDSPANQPTVNNSTGFFSQGCPFFTALIARMEWERGTWWYLPYAQRTLMVLTGSKYCLVVSPKVKKRMIEDGIRPVKNIGKVTIFEFSKASLVYKVDPIALYCKDKNNRKIVRCFTTFLNLIPRHGYKYIFVLIKNKSKLFKFNKIIIYPYSNKDVKYAIKLAEKGKRVVLVITNNNVSKYVSKRFLIGVKIGILKFHCIDISNLISREYKIVRLKRVYPMRVNNAVKVYYLNGKLVYNVRLGKGTLRLIGVNPVVVVDNVNPVPTIEGINHLALPLPDKFERNIAESVVNGMGCKVKPIKYTGTIQNLEVNEEGWLLIATRYTPEWKVIGGESFVGSGGDLIIRSNGKVKIIYNPYYPWYVILISVASLSLTLMFPKCARKNK